MFRQPTRTQTPQPSPVETGQGPSRDSTVTRKITLPLTSKTLTLTLPDHLPTSPKELITLITPLIRTIMTMPMGSDTPEARSRTLSRIRTLTNLLDTQFKIPGVGTRVGIDPVISAVPYVGDVVSTALSLYIVYLMRRFKVPWYVALRMIGNVVLNGAVGIIPGIGSLFDVAYKPNRRNLMLLEDYLRKQAVEKLGMDPKKVEEDILRTREDLTGSKELPEGDVDEDVLDEIVEGERKQKQKQPVGGGGKSTMKGAHATDEMPGGYNFARQPPSPSIYPSATEHLGAAPSAFPDKAPEYSTLDRGSGSAGPSGGPGPDMFGYDRDKSVYPSVPAPPLPPRNVTKRR